MHVTGNITRFWVQPDGIACLEVEAADGSKQVIRTPIANSDVPPEQIRTGIPTAVAIASGKWGKSMNIQLINPDGTPYEMPLIVSNGDVTFSPTQLAQIETLIRRVLAEDHGQSVPTSSAVAKLEYQGKKYRGVLNLVEES